MLQEQSFLQNLLQCNAHNNNLQSLQNGFVENPFHHYVLNDDSANAVNKCLSVSSNEVPWPCGRPPNVFVEANAFNYEQEFRGPNLRTSCSVLRNIRNLSHKSNIAASQSYNNLDKSPFHRPLTKQQLHTSVQGVSTLSNATNKNLNNLGVSNQNGKSSPKKNRPSVHENYAEVVSELQNKVPRKRRRTGGDATPSTSSFTNTFAPEVIIPDVPLKENDHSPSTDSRVEAVKLFDWLIHPVKRKNFFSDLWEKKPLLVKRHHTTYYKGIFSCKDLDAILREQNVVFSKNLDITSYEDGKRSTLNPTGRAFPSVVWDFYENGCSVRLLNPQTFSKSVWKLLSILQEFFGTCVGANMYLTPPGSQGFAPHYDDIEAFVLQLEGRKRWKLYSPRNAAEALPRYSSANFSPEEIGEPILNVELEPGDLLYFPRGTIHQASTPDDVHSLHVTVSSSQKNTWGDFLEKLVPVALQAAFEEDIEFREGLPLDYLRHVGLAHSDVDSPERQAFTEKLTRLMQKMIAYAPVDTCADQMGKNYIHDCLPPVLSKEEKTLTIHNSGERWEEGKVINRVVLEPETEIRLVRANVIRLVTEDDGVRVYYSTENSREYHGEALQFLEIIPEIGPAVECLIHTYPNYVSIEDLPIESLEQQLLLASAFFDKGLIIPKTPLRQSDNE